jgi:C1A family cysteine protease
LFGLSIGEPERIELLKSAIQESARFRAAFRPPPRIDWRNHNGNWVTPVKFQSTCGACVAFATCAVLESRAMIANGTPGAHLDLSEAHLFACGGGNCAAGWNFEPALRQAKGGIGLEKDFGYLPKDVPCQKIPPKVSVTTWNRLINASARKNAIARNGPVIAGMRVFSDFFSYGSGVYKHVTGAEEGLHAVAVVGYDDAGKYWIVKNSWDVDWGDAGFVHMGYGECGIDSEFPFFDPSVSFSAPLVS